MLVHNKDRKDTRNREHYITDKYEKLYPYLLYIVTREKDGLSRYYLQKKLVSQKKGDWIYFRVLKEVCREVRRYWLVGWFVVTAYYSSDGK